VDLVRDLIDEESAGRNDIDTAEMIAALNQAAAAGSAPVAAQGSTEAPDGAGTIVASASGASALADSGVEGTPWLVTVALEKACVLKAVRAYMVIKRLSHMGVIMETRPSERDIEDENFDLTFRVLLAARVGPEAIKQAAEFVSEVESVLVERQEIEAPVAIADGFGTARRKQIPKLSESQTVRVAIGHLDSLVDLVGELVILRSRLERLAGQRGDVELIETVDDLQRISTDLQYEVMQTRMVPVGNIFNRFPRMVRDLAVDLGKKVEFRMDGLDIELDRTVLDEIGDPLVHLLRNGIDHGLEDVEERKATGKPEMGSITLSAARERDHIAITVTDDGKGIDLDRIWAKAVERGLVQDKDRIDHSESDILQLTCVPGFSTATTTTRVSGRGVGMDVVKGKIEYLGGTVQIKSSLGKGTEFVLRLPLTLAILQSLLVETAGQVFALPLAAVNEVLMAEDVHTETVDGSPIVLLRDGSVVPLRRLDSFLFGSDPGAPLDPKSSVVLVQTGLEQTAIHVDRIDGRHEVVVKPLSRLFRDQRGFSGATILGDGRVMLILDPRALAATEA
jgi:two-component system chemotaxis sensor kinase CheA